MSAVIDKIKEIKFKIKKIQNQYAMKMNFRYKEDLKLIAYDNEWHNNELFGEGLKFKAIPQENFNNDANIFLFHTEKGHVVDKHSHDTTQIIICIKGKLRIILNNNEHEILSPWESIYIDKNHLHVTEALEDSLFISIWG